MSTGVLSSCPGEAQQVDPHLASPGHPASWVRLCPDSRQFRAWGRAQSLPIPLGEQQESRDRKERTVNLGVPLGGSLGILLSSLARVLLGGQDSAKARGADAVGGIREEEGRVERSAEWEAC